MKDHRLPDPTLVVPANSVRPDGDSDPSPTPAHVRIHPRTLSRWAVLVGLGMIGLAGVWAGIIRGRDLGAWFPLAGWYVDLLIGVVSGSAFALAAWRLMDRVPALKSIERRITSGLEMDAFGFRHALIFGLAAGIPEEILFRGAVQPVLGWPVTSLVFGALHSLTPAYFVYAAIAGGLLGGLAIWRDGLWAPIAAHTLIDVIMFALLIRSWRRTHRVQFGLKT
ncbi:MAG: CPBP family intramembrane metalloprotease [Anaerolineae bacterium]|nr:CPBP family intramembrane metalloprotease [Anaerolineae bacterium]